ncbi:hypothetical protein PtB15_9B590 [Puccinia triticina]|nr:hypothetical protein PtB15_9B590 [Puccinia triticina]
MQQEASLQDRLAVASALILQSPPGEVNDVFNDVRPIVGDDSELERGLLPALAQYNTEQLALVELPNSKIPAMICPAARVDEEAAENRYLDPHSQQTFTFDHLRLSASDLQPFVPPDPEMEKTRAELERQAESYLRNHFQNAVWTVFSVPPSSSSSSTQPDDSPASDNSVDPPPPPPEHQEIDEPPSDLDPPTDDQPPQSPPKQPDQSETQSQSTSSNKFKLYIVGNKYNPTNYWTGRWRSIYDIDMGTGKIDGLIQVNVHYYEQGNVQLSTTHTPAIETPPNGGPAEIIKAIQAAESKYQAGLNLAYNELGDNTFKLLRRALPVTKQKVNWNNMKARIVLDDH